MILHMPFFGSLIVQGHAILFFTLLAILLRAGVPLVPALKGIVTAMPNAYWRRHVQSRCVRVRPAGSSPFLGPLVWALPHDSSSFAGFSD